MELCRFNISTARSEDGPHSARARTRTSPSSIIAGRIAGKRITTPDA